MLTTGNCEANYHQVLVNGGDGGKNINRHHQSDALNAQCGDSCDPPTDQYQMDLSAGGTMIMEKTDDGGSATFVTVPYVARRHSIHDKPELTDSVHNNYK